MRRMKILIPVVVMLGSSVWMLPSPSVGQEKVPASAPPAKETGITEKHLSPLSDKDQASKREVWFDFVINAMPATLLIGLETSKFEVRSPDGGLESASTVYLMPNLTGGLGMGINDFYLDLTAGPGVIVGQNFRSFFFDLALAGSYMASDSLSVGPRVGIMYLFGPEWTGLGDVGFEETWGYFLGLLVSLGDRIRYIVAVDYVGIEFDAVPGISSAITQPELDFKALAIQFGVRGEF